MSNLQENLEGAFVTVNPKFAGISDIKVEGIVQNAPTDGPSNGWIYGGGDWIMQWTKVSA